jgi:hypothetical protein
MKTIFTLITILIPLLSFSQKDSIDNELSQEYIETPFSVKDEENISVDVLENKQSKKEIAKDKVFIKPN